MGGDMRPTARHHGSVAMFPGASVGYRTPIATASALSPCFSDLQHASDLTKTLADSAKKAIAALAICTALAACTTPKAGFCSVASPIRLSDTAVDALSDQEVARILSHNETGRSLCSWRPQ